MSHKQTAFDELDESQDNLIRVNVPMKLSLKEQWVKFAKSRNQTLASMIRDAVKYLMKKEQSTLVQPQSEIMQKLSNLETLYAQKNEEQSNLLKMLSQRTFSEIDPEKKEIIEGKILDVLENYPHGLHYKELAEKCKIKEETLLKLIGVLQQSEIIQFKTNRVKLVR